jgi:type IV pilus assembly protein PilA
MSYAKRIAALAGISVAACGGGSPPGPTPEQLAVAEATKLLEAQKPIIANAYQPKRLFPTTANSPIVTAVPRDAKYVSGISYNAIPLTAVSVVLTLTNTGNPMLDGKFLAMFGTGHFDGTVTWQCGTAVAATAVSTGAITTMYPYLPEYCQN